jgi:hypothetical protein
MPWPSAPEAHAHKMIGFTAETEVECQGARCHGRGPRVPIFRPNRWIGSQGPPQSKPSLFTCFAFLSIPSKPTMRVDDPHQMARLVGRTVASSPRLSCRSPPSGRSAARSPGPKQHRDVKERWPSLAGPKAYYPPSVHGADNMLLTKLNASPLSPPKKAVYKCPVNDLRKRKIKFRPNQAGVSFARHTSYMKKTIIRPFAILK